jgi:hypothetical protein
MNDPSRRIAAALFATALLISGVGSWVYAQADPRPHNPQSLQATVSRPVAPPLTLQASIAAVVATPTPEPTPEPTPVPTPEPTAVPTPVPTAVVRAAPAQAPVAAGGSVEDVKATIIYWANHYGVSADRLLRIAECESGYSSVAVNRNYYAGGGNPSGIFQYLPATWASFSAKAGLAGASIWDYRAQARVTAWAFANGLSSHWECQ